MLTAALVLEFSFYNAQNSAFAKQLTLTASQYYQVETHFTPSNFGAGGASSE